MLLFATGGTTPTVNDTGKSYTGSTVKTFTVTSVNSGAHTFAVTYGDATTESGIPQSKFHPNPGTNFIVGNDIYPLSAPTVNQTGKCWVNGVERAFTVSAVHSGTSTFDIEFESIEGIEGLAYGQFVPATTCDYIVCEDIHP